MNFRELRYQYIDFFKSKNHSHIASASLIPENDPTVLFTTAGMHPLVPYLLGQSHPSGQRLVNWQKCIRTGDIDEVGDDSHLTFFEMLGNWSLNDYFKEEAICWSFEFLTQKLNFTVDQIHVTVFAGDQDAPRDEESALIWKKIGVKAGHIHYKPKADNWWGPAGLTGPCGPDSEMFIDTGKESCGEQCSPGCHCGKYFEIWNDVFMQYYKNEDGSYSPMQNKNVDTGMGIERTVAMMQGKKSVYETEIFAPIIEKIETMARVKYAQSEEIAKAIRIIADHCRTAVFIIGDEKGITPSNLGAGYVLRRLIRRAIRFGKKLQLKAPFLSQIAPLVVAHMHEFYPELKQNESKIYSELEKEELKFEVTLQNGLNELEKIVQRMTENNQTVISGRLAFKLYDTYGFPFEFTRELALEKGLQVDEKGYQKAFDKHKALSRQAQNEQFKGGLADHSQQTTRLHTATHLLHTALRKILGDHIQQKGSNITPERLRFDFTHPEKIEPAVIQQIEDLVNEQIKRSLPISMETMSIDDARQKGAIALFTEKYEQQVKVYRIGDFSLEVCGGPHVSNTSELGRFKIKKEQSSSAGVRRIRAVLFDE